MQTAQRACARVFFSHCVAINSENLEYIFCALYTLNVNVTTTLRYFTNLDRVCDVLREGDARRSILRSPRNRYQIYAINTTGIKIGV